MDNKMWRFIPNNYGPDKGLDDGDVETFKKDPNGAISRESSQNTIDGQYKDKPARIEFKLFELEREKIPGIELLTREIEKCYDYKKDSPKEGKSLKLMHDYIHQDVIKCLRISDFNTTGLLGVSTNERSKPFYNLTKGSGVSDKTGTSGGSKGIGKFASFVGSTTNTVFYSTKTVDKEVGYIGISKLRSVPLDNDSDMLTMGIGYYSLNEKNEPILEELNLDPTFKRNDNVYGTDIYLIGFNDSNGWKNEIITKILDSFMVAIMRSGFEVVVGDTLINKDTIENILIDDKIFSNSGKLEVKDIKAQYELLCDQASVSSKDILIDNKYRITVYVKKYSYSNEKKANKRCLMVRYPYMKIKHTTGHSHIPFSALCIIHDNELNEMLRNIENPQHTDWEIKRLDDFPDEKRETKRLKRDMKREISNYIKEVLRESNSETTDVEGAGKYLPDQTESGNIRVGENAVKDTMSMSQLRKNKNKSSKKIKPGSESESFDFDNSLSDGENEGRFPNDGSDEANPNTESEHLPGEEKEVGENGDKSGLRKKSLNAIRYKNIVVDKNKGRYDIIFKSLYDENKCELTIKMYGEGMDKYPINIMSASINNQKCEVSNGKIVNFEIKKNQKYKIACILNTSKLFSSEVILNAYR